MYDEIKCVIVQDTLLGNTDLNNFLYIHTYSGIFQFGLVIIHQSKSKYFCCRKLRGNNKRYTVMGK